MKGWSSPLCRSRISEARWYSLERLQGWNRMLGLVDIDGLGRGKLALNIKPRGPN